MLTMMISDQTMSDRTP